MLHSIRALREEHTTLSPQLMTHVYHTLAMLHCILKDTAKVRLSSLQGFKYRRVARYSPTFPNTHTRTHTHHL